MKQAIPILLLVLLASTQAPSISFTIYQLSIDSELKAVTLFDNGAIAVGEAGLVAIAYNDGGRILEKPVDVDLRDISCIDSKCLAVGRGGVVLEIDTSKQTFRTLKISDADLYRVASSDKYFYIYSSRREIIVYTLGKGVTQVYQYGRDLNDIVYGDKLYILSRDGVESLEGYSLKIKAEKIAWTRDLGLIILDSNGVYSVSENTTIASGRYDNIASCSSRSITLSSGNILYLWSLDKGLRIVSTLTFKPNDIACIGDRVYAVGSKGYFIEADGEGSRLLFAPSGKYTTASSDHGLAIIAGEKALLYKDGYFKEVETPEGNYKSSSISNGLAVLLGREKMVTVSEEGVKILPYRVEEYNDLWVTGGRILLAGRKGLLEASLEGLNIREIYSGGELYSVSGAGAVGKNLIITASGGEYRVNVSLRSVDSIPCGLVAVGDKGMITVLRDGNLVYDYTPGGENLKSIAVKPDSSYALIGGASGGLYLWDGYRVSQLPYRASGEVSDITWVSNNEALITAGGKLLLFREEGYGEPRLEVITPESFTMYNGSEKTLKITLNPFNGYSGSLQPSIIVEGIDGVWVSTVEKLDVKPLCPVVLEVKVRASPEAKGSGKLSIILGGEEKEMPLIVEVKGRESGERSGSILPNIPIPVIAMITGAIAIIIATYIIVSKMFKKPPRREAPKPEEKPEEEGWEKPREGEGGEEEW